MSVRSALPLAALVTLVLVGCPAAKLYREGYDLDERGDDYQAALKYLDALDANEHLKKAQGALAAVAPDAYAEQLDLAGAAEQQGDFPRALREYRSLKTMLDRLDARGIEFPVIDVHSKIGEMENAAAEDRYRAGEAFLGAGAWEKAIAEYSAAQGFKSAYKDSEEKTAFAYYAWGEEEVGKRAYRSGAEHYLKAMDHGGRGYKDAAAKSGDVYAALGRHFVKADRCRQAVRDLRQARDLLGVGKVDGDIVAAESCAVTPVAILPLENPTGGSVAGMALGDTIADVTASKVKAGASEFVRLMERSALDAVLAEQGLSTSGLTGGASKVKGVRYLVLGKLTQVRLVKNPPRASQATLTSRIGYRCEKTGNDGKVYASTCYKDVTLSYTDHTAEVSLDVGGSLRVVDVLTGEQLASPAVQARATDAVHWADNFRDAGGTPVTIVQRGRTGGVEVDDSYIKLAQARTALTDEGQLASQVVEAIASQAASETLKVVDVEKKALDPSSLEFTTLR